jgi:hypothetical protein
MAGRCDLRHGLAIVDLKIASDQSFIGSILQALCDWRVQLMAPAAM